MSLFTGHEKAAELLIQNRANMNAVGQHKNTPLMMAAAKGRNKQLVVCITSSCDIEWLCVFVEWAIYPHLPVTH